MNYYNEIKKELIDGVDIILEYALDLCKNKEK